jgi:hypothetical protein
MTASSPGVGEVQSRLVPGSKKVLEHFWEHVKRKEIQAQRISQIQNYLNIKIKHQINSNT